MSSGEKYPYGHLQYHFLERYYHLTMVLRDPRIKFSLERKQSEVDTTTLSLFTIEPAEIASDNLFFFFHGMDGDCGDAIIAKDMVTDCNAKIVGIGGRGPCWLSDAFIRDVQSVIREHSAGFNMFHLMGVSMGATQALSLAALLPDELKDKLAGVIALIPGANMAEVVKDSSRERVIRTLTESVGGDMGKLAIRSPINLVEEYREDLPFVIFHNENDAILLACELEKFINDLSKQNRVSTFSNKGDHEFNFKNFDFKQLFDELGKTCLKKKPAPLKEETFLNPD